MKQIYILLLAMLCSTGLMAQLPDGSTAPDWTITDLDGGTHNLYDILDSGKSVIIDFSATWCPPCWSYHQTHIMEDMYNEYGPTGTVNPNQIEVFYIESDDATNDPCMTNSAGCTGGTQGDWTAGTSYPMTNPANEAIPSSYAINAYPTLLAVCPNKKLYEVGQASKATWESWLLQTCALDSDFLAGDELCAGDGTGSIDLTTTGGAGNITYSWSNGETTEDLVNVPQGMYSVTVTEGRGHSVELGPIEVAGPAVPVAVGTNEVNSVQCNGEGNGSVSVSGAGGTGAYTYQWSNGATTPMISSLDGGTYDVIITDTDGCTVAESYVVDEPMELTSAYNAVPASCGNTNGLLSITSEGGTGPFNYDIGVDNNSTGVFINIPAGIYNAIVTDANNCSVVYPILVENLPGPEAAASGSGMISCANTELTLSGEGSTEGGLINYTWSTTDGVIVSGENTLNPVIGSAGTYVIEVLDAQTGCVETSSVTIDSDVATPVAMSNDEETIDCTNAVAVLDGNGSDEGANYSYLWTTENGNISGDATMLVSEANAGGVYTLIVTNNANGCSSSSEVIVNQTAELPVSNAGAASSLTCVVSEVVLDGSESSDGDNYTYTWTTDDGNIVSGSDSPLATVNASGTYLLEVINTINGCSALSSVIVSLDEAIPAATIADAEELTCVLTEMNLNVDVDVTGAYTTSWTTADGNIVSGEDTNMPIVDAPGEYIVTIVSEANGCSSSQTITISENINMPMAAYDFTNMDKSFTFTNTSIGSPTGYMWTFGDNNTSTDENPTHEYVDNGDYEVCLTITNECGDNTTCSTVTVSAGSALVFELSTENATCNAECNGIYSIIPADAIENYTVAVTGPNGFTSEDFGLESLCAGDYTFTMMNEIGESIDGTFEIEEPTAISVTSSEVVNVDCFEAGNGSISLGLEGGTGDITIMWSNGIEGNEISELSEGTYTATATDANGCVESYDFIVSSPTAVVLVDSEVTDITDATPAGSIDIEIDGGTAGYSYLWSSGQETQDITDLGEGEYTVIVTDANGCSKEFGPFEVQTIIAVIEIESLNSFDLLPNPATDDVAINLNFDKVTNAKVEIVNNLGQTINSNYVTGKAVSVKQNVKAFAPGLYIVKITVDDQSSIRKLIVE